MHFVDRTLVRLADPASRVELFTPVVAERLAVAAFGTSETLTEPFAAVVDRLTLGVTCGSETQLRARVRPPDGRVWDVEASAGGFDAAASFMPAVVEGFLSATAQQVNARVATVEARGGALPNLAALEANATPAERANATLLERRRRIELAHRLADPALQDAEADLLARQWLTGAGVSTVEELIAVGEGPHGVARLALTFEPPEAGPPGVRSTRFVAGVVIDALSSEGGALLGMLERTRELQKLVATAGRRTEPLAGLEPTYAVPVLWFVPHTQFDDDDWPLDEGASLFNRPASREARAAAWLAGHGIVLAGIP
jgi:hypothetical protein